MSKDVFISHASADAALATRICEELEQQGVSCWIAPRDIPTGAVFDEAILDAIEQSSATILILSAHANNSNFVKTEINRAFANGKHIITFRIEDVMPARALELYLARHHWTDGFPPPVEERIIRMAIAVRALVGETPISSPPMSGQTNIPAEIASVRGMVQSQVAASLSSPTPTGPVRLRITGTDGSTVDLDEAYLDYYGHLHTNTGVRVRQGTVESLLLWQAIRSIALTSTKEDRAGQNPLYRYSAQIVLANGEVRHLTLADDYYMRVGYAGRLYGKTELGEAEVSLSDIANIEVLLSDP